MFMNRESLARCLVGVATPQREQYSEKVMLLLGSQREGCIFIAQWLSAFIKQSDVFLMRFSCSFLLPFLAQ